MKDLSLVTAEEEAIANIFRFNNALPRKRRLLLDSIRYAQSWYAIETDDGYMFGPSKYIGYRGMEPQIYAEQHNQSMDGRLTDRQLKQWARPVDVGTADYESILGALNAFCQQQGVMLNKRARISMLSSARQDNSAVTEADRVNAIRIFIEDLSEDGKRALKRLVWGD